MGAEHVLAFIYAKGSSHEERLSVLSPENHDNGRSFITWHRSYSKTEERCWTGVGAGRLESEDYTESQFRAKLLLKSYFKAD